MTKERELLNRCVVTLRARDICPLLLKEISELLNKPDQDPFRAGIMYSAKKYRYATVARELFTGNDVALFLEMEACEISNDTITKFLEMDDE